MSASSEDSGMARVWGGGVDIVVVVRSRTGWKVTVGRGVGVKSDDGDPKTQYVFLRIVLLEGAAKRASMNDRACVFPVTALYDSCCFTFFAGASVFYPSVFLFLLFYAPEDVIGHDKLLIGLWSLFGDV